MSYAYIQGKEAEALSFFEKLLNQPLAPNERIQLEKLIEELREKVKDSEKSSSRHALQDATLSNLQTC